MKRHVPWFIGKTIKVETKEPFYLIVEYETGEKKIIDMNKYIDNDPELKPLKTIKGLFEKAEPSLCGYMTQWYDGEASCFFHNDIVYVNGDDYD